MTLKPNHSASPRAPNLGLLTAAGLLVVLLSVGGLVAYKAAASMKVLAQAQAEPRLQAKAQWIPLADVPTAVRPFADAVNYFGWVMIALAFGVVIGASVRAFVPTRWLERTVAAEGVRGAFLAAIVGAPLMLCSCCVAPVFEGVYGRTRRLGASLGLMLAAPMLNPAVLAVTFLLFPAAMAWSRIAASALLVVFGAALLGRMFRTDAAAVACPIESSPRSWRGLLRDFVSSLGVVAWLSLPAIVIGVVVSAVIAGLVPIDTLPAAGMSTFVLIALVAAVAVPLALPTFGEIPLALALLAAGAPAGCAMALLIAGPAINLPSLLMLARTTSWKVAVSTTAVVFGIAVASGVIVDALVG